MGKPKTREGQSTDNFGDRFEVVENSEQQPIPFDTMLQSFARLLVHLAEKEGENAQRKQVA